MASLPDHKQVRANRPEPVEGWAAQWAWIILLLSWVLFLCQYFTEWRIWPGF